MNSMCQSGAVLQLGRKIADKGSGTQLLQRNLNQNTIRERKMIEEQNIRNKRETNGTN